MAMMPLWMNMASESVPHKAGKVRRNSKEEPTMKHVANDEANDETNDEQTNE